MIEKISIEGYKSIKELKDFELKPLNVLIGPNKGGKSNFLDSLSFLGEAVQGKLSKGLVSRGGIKQVLWAGHQDRDISIEVTLAGPTLYSFILTPSLGPGYEIAESFNGQILRRGESINDSFPSSIKTLRNLIQTELILSQPSYVAANPTLANLWLSLQNIIYYQWLDTSARSPIRQPCNIETTKTPQDTTLEKDGANLTNVYYHLFHGDENSELKNEIMSILESVFDDFQELKFPPIHGRGVVQFGWQEKHFKRPLYQSELSDGTLKCLSLLAIFLNPNTPYVVCIDEPEIGLHPYMMDVLAELIIDASNRMQIVLTTHSPRFLGNFKPEHIVVVENEDGESKFNRPDPERLEKWLKSFHLGKLYEMGELGGLM